MARRDYKEVKRSDHNHDREGGAGGCATPSPEVIEKGKKMKENADKLMDEIDNILEENAEQFVKNYIQKGGE